MSTMMSVATFNKIAVCVKLKVNVLIKIYLLLNQILVHHSCGEIFWVNITMLKIIVTEAMLDGQLILQSMSTFTSVTDFYKVAVNCKQHIPNQISLDQELILTFSTVPNNTNLILDNIVYKSM